MFLLWRPSLANVQSFLDNQLHAPLSYSPIGLTRNVPSTGYNIDHTRIRLGTGAVIFNSAIAAVRNWKMFDFSWLQLYSPTTPIEQDAVVAIVVHHLGFWSMNACRIVDVIESNDEHGARFGFAYGTLRDHAEHGEERFMIEWDQRDDSVWYDILAVSKPGWIARVGYWYARHLQREFAKFSTQAMAQAVSTRGDR